MAEQSPATGSPASGTEAAIAAVVVHIAESYPGRESAILAALVIHTVEHFLDQPGGDGFASGLNFHLAALGGQDEVWQLGRIPRAALAAMQPPQ